MWPQAWGPVVGLFVLSQLVGQGLMGAEEATEMCVSLFVGGLAELSRAAPDGA